MSRPEAERWSGAGGPPGAESSSEARSAVGASSGPVEPVENRRRMDASMEEVFTVLTDPRAFGCWVVGARKVTGWDDSWPSPGSRFYHEVGAWPVVFRDNTKVLEIDPPRRLVLEARVRPLGFVAHITLELEPDGEGCSVWMDERMAGKPMRLIPQPVLSTLVRPRNAEALRRLEWLVKGRRDAAAG